MIYLDHNATTPVLPEVFEAMRPYFCEEWGNPSSSYRFGSKLKGVIETAREQVAELLGAQPREIIFTSCATESNNAAILSALKTSPAKRHVVTSVVEHSSVLNLFKTLEENGYKVTYLPVDNEGLFELENFESALSEDTALVSLIWANNETGVIFPVEQIASICKARGILFHSDGVQAAGKLKIDLADLPLDFLTISGHKFYAPKGVGALYVRRKVPFYPFLHGGHQEAGRRGGTENTPLIVGMGKAAEIVTRALPSYETYVRPLRDFLETELLKSQPNAERNGHKTQRLVNTTNITFHGTESEALLLLLDQSGICASSGAACLADSDEPSHVISAMRPDSAAKRQMIRFSLGSRTNKAELQKAIPAIQSAVSTLSLR